VALIYFVMRLLRQLQAVGSAPPIDYAYLRSVPGTSCTPANPEVGGAVLSAFVSHAFESADALLTIELATVYLRSDRSVDVSEAVRHDPAHSEPELRWTSPRGGVSDVRQSL
jgi:hypothetical protein